MACITLGIVTLSVTVAYAQVRKTQEWNRRKASQDLLLQVVLGDVTELRRELEIKFGADLAQNPLPTCETIFTRLNADEAKAKEFAFLFKKLFNYFETIAIGIKNNVFDEEICYDHLAMVATRYWTWGEPHILRVRSVSPTIWIEIDNLSRRWKEKLNAETDKLRSPGKGRM